MHAAQRKQKTLPPHEDRLLSGLLGPQPHSIFRYDDEASHPPPLSGTSGDAQKALPLVDLNMRTAAWIWCTVFSLLLCKLEDGKKNCILMLKSSHLEGAKTFQNLKTAEIV